MNLSDHLLQQRNSYVTVCSPCAGLSFRKSLPKHRTVTQRFLPFCLHISDIQSLSGCSKWVKCRSISNRQSKYLRMNWKPNKVCYCISHNKNIFYMVCRLPVKIFTWILYAVCVRAQNPLLTPGLSKVC